MDKILDETQPGTPLDQRLQLIQPIDDHLPEPVECIVVVTPYYVE
jgi:hypothetical protein